MPLVTRHLAVAPATLNDPQRRWQPMDRIETIGTVNDVSDKLAALLPQKVVYAEGDSWFDKFTPIPNTGTNLLGAIRTPFRTAVVDMSRIGDESADMVRGIDASQTRALFNLHSFDAIVLSAGGNDLKNLFATRFADRARQHGGTAPPLDADELRELITPSAHAPFFAQVIGNIGAFIAMRDSARDARTRAAPILLHGYDYFQPRPAGAVIFAGTRLGRGPWLYPILLAAGLTDAQMRSTADAVVDEFNRQLAAAIAPLNNVHVIDQRGLLVPAAAGSEGPDADWLDEIHPDSGGFETLARSRWDVPLALALGWQPRPGDTVPALDPRTVSTAGADAPRNVA